MSQVFVQEDMCKHPVDRGWAWVILIACQTVAFLYVGTLRSSGIFFIEYLNTFKASASMASLVSGMQIAFNSIVLLPLMIFGIKYFSVRQCVVFGGFLMSLSFMLSSFATSIEYLIFSQSIIFGVGSAFVYSPCMIIICKYFEKRRGFANGMFISACSLGGLVLPFFFRLVLDEYGLRGGMMLTSGLLSHILVAGTLLRPPELYERKVKTNKIIINSSNSIQNEASLVNNGLVVKTNTDNVKHLEINALSSSQPLISLANGTTTKVYTTSSNNLRLLAGANNSEPCLKARTRKSDIFRSFNELASASLADLRMENQNRDINFANDICDRNRFTRLKLCWSSLFDYNIITNKSLILFVSAFCFGSMNGALAVMFIPKFSSENGVDLYSSTSLVSVIGATDLIGRFSSGLLSDWKRIKNYQIIVISQTIASVVMYTSSLCEDYLSLIIFTGIFGLFAGMLFSLYPIMILDILGKENLPVGLALAMMSQGIAIAITTPILGLLRDVTGTYHATFYYLGTTSLISVILFMFTPCFQDKNNINIETIVECE